MALTYPIIRMTIGSTSISFRGGDIIDASVLQEIHPVGIELPASTASVRIRTTDPRFSPYSDGEFYQQLVAGLVVDFYEMVESDEVYIGRFYLDTWSNPVEGEIEFNCIDAIGVLGNLEYDGKFWETETSAYSIISDILASSDIGYSIDDVTAGKMLKGYLPGNKSVRDSLQQVLFATGAFASTANSAIINIKQGVIPLPGALIVGYAYDSDVALYDEAIYSDLVVGEPITDVNKTDKQKLDVLPLVTGVEVISHDYQRGDTIEEIFSATLEPGDYKIVYSKPFHTVWASGVGDAPVFLALADDKLLVTADSVGVYPDVTLLTLFGEFEFGVNYVWLHVLPPGGSVVVTGKPYLDGTRSFFYSNPDAITAPPNIWKISDGTLVYANIADAVLNKVVAYALLRYQHNIKLFPLLGIELGDVKIVDALYGKDMVEIIERISSDLTGGYLLDVELVGVERIIS